MHIKNLSLLNYRNYSKKYLNFEKNLNIITGKNGTGKTNILESIFLIATTTSHRTALNSDLIKKDREMFTVKAEIENSYGVFDITLMYKKEQGLKAVLNLSHIRNIELIQKFPVVMFSPWDIDILKGSPVKLRRMININISQVHSSYIHYLIKYRRLINHRNKLLKDHDIRNNEKKKSVLVTLTEMLKKYTSAIEKIRREYINKINKFIEVESENMGLSDNILIAYMPSVFRSQSIDDDLRYGYTTWGSHRDNFSFYLNGSLLKAFASRGEIRMVSFLYKLAVWRMLKEYQGKDPVILLDDIFSELDSDKRKIISKRIEGVQTIITSCEWNLHPKMAEGFDSPVNVIRL